MERKVEKEAQMETEHVSLVTLRYHIVSNSTPISQTIIENSQKTLQQVLAHVFSWYRIIPLIVNVVIEHLRNKKETDDPINVQDNQDQNRCCQKLLLVLSD